ncbi:hypothetical protein [Ornithinimicrobium kibberense]|uniref:hypothetical protein n=1 Tax=Ornithinimicrobium kibberense TaxID=282060 RepID=UPI00361F3922
MSLPGLCLRLGRPRIRPRTANLASENGLAERCRLRRARGRVPLGGAWLRSLCDYSMQTDRRRTLRDDARRRTTLPRRGRRC